MRRIGPTLQITLGLVFLTNFLIVIADTVFNVLPDRTSQMMKVRKSVSEGMGVQVATLMQFGDRLALEQSLEALRQRSNEVRSIAVRRAPSSDGSAAAPSIQTSPPSKCSCFQIGAICFSRSIA